MNNDTREPVDVTKLSEADAQALDALLGADSATGMKLAGDTEGSDERTQRMSSLLSLIAQCPAEAASDDLVQRTLARVRDEQQRERFAQQVESLSGPPVAFRWTEAVAVAAVLLMAVSIVWPMLASSRDEARRVACSNNLRLTGVAMQRYARDFGGLLPVRDNLGDVWYEVGDAADLADRSAKVNSNTANLAPLWQNNYLNTKHLACPDNRFAPRQMSAMQGDFQAPAQRSYSYQNQWGGPVKVADHPQLALLADRNPLIDLRASADQPGRVEFAQDTALELTAPSLLHGADGQNVLVADGNVVWASVGVMSNGDRIWVPDSKPGDTSAYRYTGSDAPARSGDSMLVP